LFADAPLSGNLSRYILLLVSVLFAASGVSSAVAGSVLLKKKKRSKEREGDSHLEVSLGVSDIEESDVSHAELTEPVGFLAYTVAKRHVKDRLIDVENSRKERLSARRLSHFASTTLTVGQYIVGGVLASSFVQESLTPKSVGAIGVLVLIASLLREHFRPEITAREARNKAFQLLALQRSSKDQLAVLEAKSATGQDHSDAMISLLRQVTQRLSEIEDPEGSQSKP